MTWHIEDIDGESEQDGAVTYFEWRVYLAHNAFAEDGHPPVDAIRVAGYDLTATVQKAVELLAALNREAV